MAAFYPDLRRIFYRRWVQRTIILWLEATIGVEGEQVVHRLSEILLAARAGSARKPRLHVFPPMEMASKNQTSVDNLVNTTRTQPLKKRRKTQTASKIAGMSGFSSKNASENHNQNSTETLPRGCGQNRSEHKNCGEEKQRPVRVLLEEADHCMTGLDRICFRSLGTNFLPPHPIASWAASRQRASAIRPMMLTTCSALSRIFKGLGCFQSPLSC